MQRRSFLVGSITGSALLACRSWTHPRATVETPTAHELLTLAAMAETFLPGGDGTPGAHEINAVATIVQPAYGVNPYLSEVVSDLDDWCRVAHRRVFVELSAGERERALEQRMGLHGRLLQSVYLPVYEGILALTKVAFFGGITSRFGTNYLAYPGPSTGYAPASAAGAYAASDTPRAIELGMVSPIRVTGDGAASRVHASVFVTTNDDVKGTLRVTSPDGRTHDLPLDASSGDAVIDDLEVPLAGGPAAGDWRLSVISHRGGSGRLELWSLRLRTDLDDRG